MTENQTSKKLSFLQILPSPPKFEFQKNIIFFLISINLNEENISVECSDIMYEMFPLPLQFTFWECPMKLEIQMDWTLGAVVTT